ncbi:MAG TPA: hypothetical protein VF911_00990 [Thermoanaerobaculia bacterium]
MLLRLLFVVLVAAPSFAKTLHWNAIDVEARLDRDGNLHVSERQQMVLDGDWNGGERTFNLRPGQDVEVERIVRIDGEREIPLTRGSLDELDHWDLASTDVARWRSRMPTDPPFSNQELTYRIDYLYRNILVPVEGKRFRLDHDFGLPDREGIVKRFALRLTFDPIWSAQPISLTRENQQPGEGMPVEQELTYAGEGMPAGVELPLPFWVPLLVLLAFAAGVFFILRRFLADERRVGRLVAVPARFDDELLKLQPEVAGAVWDMSIGAPEVAAVLARLTQEGKLTTRAEGRTLHLRLNVPRQKFAGYERDLIAKLFYDGGTETDTDSIRTHYARTGFDPSTEIRPAIETKLDKLAGWNTKVERFSRPLDAGLIALTLVLLIAAAFIDAGPGAVVAVVGGLVASSLFTLFACFAAAHYSKSVTNVATAVALPSLLMAVASLPLVFCCVASWLVGGLRAPLLFALMLWTLALAKLVFDLLRIKDTPAKIAYRKRIAGARQYFEEQLRRDTPDLRDEWFPYVLAFGLGKQVDRWFRSFGGETSHASSSAWSSSSTSSSSSSGSQWTGGGGAFGGAGASGTWAVAAGAMAAGVSAPSSSGSGGSSGGGGSSSGGGGGGGW